MIGWMRRTWPWLCLSLFLALVSLLALAAFEPAPPPSRPRLVVLVVFDQMRADYLERWQDLFGEGGLRRLQTDGTWFRNCHYPYAFTFTGPGHASLLTGTCPDRHGIIENDWYERDAGITVGCVACEPSPGLSLTQAAAGNVSPDRLLAPTVGDVLKEETHGRARVVSLSFKDRAAVLLGGHRADLCYWLNGTSGDFVTSPYYPGQRSWVKEFNHLRPADRWLGTEWNRLRSDLDYVRFSGPDDAPGEASGFGQGNCFPHPFPKSSGTRYYSALFNSPFGNDLLLDLACRAVDAENLGSRDVPDLLCVSFSSNDAIGHCYGPDSQEVMDVTLRSDRIVRDLLTHLDARVGRGNYLLALTADHGVCPLPETTRAKGQEADRIGPEILKIQASLFLNRRFGVPKGNSGWVEALSGPWFYLNRKLIHDHGLPPTEVEDALAGWLREQRGVLTTYTKTQLEGSISPGDKIGRQVQRSYYPGRCGDVALVLKPNSILWPLFPGTGTTHGTLNEYDTHVPLLVYGPDIPAGISSEPVTPQAVAAILSRGLKIHPPAMAEAPIPLSLR